MKPSSFSLRTLSVAGASLLLAGCAGLHDVDNKWCPPEQAPRQAAAPEQETITLKADALFRFDRSAAKDILPAGRAELDALAGKLSSGYARIDRIDLEGHTDRLGSDAYNQRLSQARADTVMRYLKNRGVQAPMTAKGMGESHPVTTGCRGEVATAKLIACLQPDRRVEVHITGIRQK